VGRGWPPTPVAAVTCAATAGHDRSHRTTLVVTTDHGHTDRGGHGGTEIRSPGFRWCWRAPPCPARGAAPNDGPLGGAGTADPLCARGGSQHRPPRSGPRRGGSRGDPAPRLPGGSLAGRASASLWACPEAGSSLGRMLPWPGSGPSLSAASDQAEGRRPAGDLALAVVVPPWLAGASWPPLTRLFGFLAYRLAFPPRFGYR
jgi:hypothetical protein